jgi:sodium-dependent dicarboxylate transporter 2/3/5
MVEMNDAIERISAAEEQFERLRRTSGFFIGPSVFLILFLIPMRGLSPQAHTLAAILGLVVVWWMTEPIPIPVTALIGASLSVVLGVENVKKVFAPFADPIVFLFIGSFILAQGIRVHRLDKRFALSILGLPWVGCSSSRVLFAFGLLAVLVSMWVSNTATTAMLFPIGLGILNAIAHLHSRHPSELKYSTGMMLMTAYGASVGGIGTPVGTPPNLIGIGMIGKLLGIRISFFQWMMLALPLLVVMYGGLFLLLNRLFPSEFKQLEGVADYVTRERAAMGKMSKGERNVLIAFLFTVSLWVLPGILALIFGSGSPPCVWCESHIPEGIVAIVGASLLFFLPVNRKERIFTISWKEAVEIDWGTIILFGGGLSLGNLMFTTGLADAVGKGVLELTGARTLLAVTAVATGLGILTSELTSNTASANMVIPIMISLALAARVNPLPPALGACIGASYGFMLPVSTPPNAIVYGSGLVPITKMIRSGFLFDILGFLLIVFGVSLLSPIIGLSS